MTFKNAVVQLHRAESDLHGLRTDPLIRQAGIPDPLLVALIQLAEGTNALAAEIDRLRNAGD